VVFEDKEAVHVRTVRAQPLRRSMPEKTGGATGCTARVAAPKLRWAMSENVRRRQRRSSSTSSMAVVTDRSWGSTTQRLFGPVAEAFIAKQQTWLYREESLLQ
jgi:hypothetical protein